MIRLTWGQWPRTVRCPVCLQPGFHDRPEDELRWWKLHAACFPTPIREALLAAWGQPGIHGGGLDPYVTREDLEMARGSREEV